MEKKTLLEKLQSKRQARLVREELIRQKNDRGFEKEIKLEKGDLFAILISGLLSFVLPIMLAIGAICGAAYLLLMCF